MELSRGEILYNQAAEKYNELLSRYQALQKENERLKEELTEWKRLALASQRERVG